MGEQQRLGTSGLAPACAVQGEQLLGAREGGVSAPCVVREVQLPHAAPGGHENGATGEQAGAATQDSDATEDEGDGEDGGGAAAALQQRPAADPEAVVYVVEWLGEGGSPSGSRASLRRVHLQRPADSPLAALTPQLLGQWVEAVASAEPVAVGGGGAGCRCARVAGDCSNRTALVVRCTWRRRWAAPARRTP